MLNRRQNLENAIKNASFPSYVYSYPPKRAYRVLDERITLEQIWGRHTGDLNLYVHVPFCHYHCSFCTLFTTTHTNAEWIDLYLTALERQAGAYAELCGSADIRTIYLGGGTPTALGEDGLERLFTALGRRFPRRDPSAEVSVESSPDAMTPSIAECLRDLGVNRVSIGLQSLDERELRATGRRYPLEAVRRAAEAVRDAGFPNVNYDLIYGLEGQSMASWTGSLRAVMDLAPTTVTLYPVVMRPATVIRRRYEMAPDSFASGPARYDFYDAATDVLLDSGFEQNSLVRFSRLDRDGYLQEKLDFEGVPLLGLGASARSYSANLHYECQVSGGRVTVAEVLKAYFGFPYAAGTPVEFGYRLDEAERRRRYLLLSLSLGRASQATYHARFGRDLHDDFGAETAVLTDLRLAVTDEAGVRLTRAGFRYSSAVAEFLSSPEVLDREAEAATAPRGEPDGQAERP